MGKSIGLLELKSIPVGIETADAVLKAANVELLTATPTCPGKYVIIICGAVGAVKSAMESGRQTAGIYLVGHHTINNVHASVPEAIVGTLEVGHIASIGERPPDGDPHCPRPGRQGLCYSHRRGFRGSLCG